jgi:uncharacterized membrane protein YqhA
MMSTEEPDVSRDAPEASTGLARSLPNYTRYVIVVPVFGLFAGAVTLTVMAAVETARVIVHAVGGELAKKDAVLEFIELADIFLLATVLYIMALGLYELFIDDSIPLPAWLQVHSLDDLKDKLVGVIAVVLAVSFLGSVIKGIEPQALMYQGAGIAAVVGAMGYFLKGGKRG